MFATGKLAERGAIAPTWALRSSRRRAQRGVVVVEYVMVLSLVCGIAGSAIVLLGLALARFFAAQEAWLSLPIP